MTAPHAFQCRHFFTCATCGWSEPGHTFCRMNDRPIHWDTSSYGCGHYCAGEEPEEATYPKLEAFL